MFLHHPRVHHVPSQIETDSLMNNAPSLRRILPFLIRRTPLPYRSAASQLLLMFLRCQFHTPPSLFH